MNLLPRQMMAAFALAAFGCAWAQAQAMLPMAGASGTPTTAPTAAAPAMPAKPITLNLDLSPTVLDMDHLQKSELGFMPAGVQLVDEKPTFITKEPAYAGKPLYGAFRIGDGPRSITYFAVDEAKGQPGKIYIDLNQNGDLTDDGPGKWDETKDDDGVTFYSSTVALHASWGSPVKEDEQGSYTIMLYKRDGDHSVNFTKLSARTGTLKLDGKSYAVLLSENTNDGIFTVPVRGDRTRRPVDFMIDLDGDGTFKGARLVKDGKNYYVPECYSIDEPFQLDNQWWMARPSISGSELHLVPTSAPGTKAPKEPEEEEVLLSTGVAAPDFTAQTPDGKPIHLSDFKGKVVILDFWATWCGPCQKSMPGLEKIYEGIRDQGVVVLSVNVFDDKDPFDAWILKHSGTNYNFTFAYDPAGHDIKKSIAASKFGVSGIPTMYVIGRDGKVTAALVGSGNEEKLTAVLNSQGIKTKAG